MIPARTKLSDHCMLLPLYDTAQAYIEKRVAESQTTDHSDLYIADKNTTQKIDSSVFNKPDMNTGNSELELNDAESSKAILKIQQ
jgi:hypothetical protein